jgi:hypothetical protein
VKFITGVFCLKEMCIGIHCLPAGKGENISRLLIKGKIIKDLSMFRIVARFLE